MLVTETRPRLVWMDCLRATAVLLVVIEHAVLLAPENLPSAYVATNAVFSPFRIPTLILLSGWLLAGPLARKTAGNFLWGKVSKLAWPYLLWSLAYFAMGSLSDRGVNQPLPNELLNPTSPTWYIGYLFTYYVLAKVFDPVRSYLIPVTFIAAYLCNDAGWWPRFFFLFGFFLVGDLLGQHWSRIGRTLTSRPAIVVAVAIAAPAAIVSAAGRDLRHEAIWAVPMLAAIIACIPVFEALGSTRAGKKLAGSWRFTIVPYLVHWPAQIVAIVALREVGVTSGAIVFWVAVFVGIVSGYIALRVLDKVPALWWLFEIRGVKRVSMTSLRQRAESQ